MRHFFRAILERRHELSGSRAGGARIGRGARTNTGSRPAPRFTWLDPVIAAIVDSSGVQIAPVRLELFGVDGLPSAVVRDTDW